MIKHYTAHAANERTYLAWIRTAIGILIFGFLIERFDLILAHLQNGPGAGANIQVSGSAELAGLSLLCLGIALVVSASVRFFIYKNLIDKIEHQEYGVGAKKTSLVLVLLIMVILCIIMLGYIGNYFF